jgi:hypothetical protein
MNTSTLAQRARAALARLRRTPLRMLVALPGLARWAWDRARERSTIAGVGLLLAAIGKHAWADWFAANADAVAFALTLIGGALAAASTSKGSAS